MTVEAYRGMFSLEGRKAIVTGGSRGIGKAIAEGLAAHGADIAIVVQHSVDRAEELAATIRELGRQALVLRADVSSEPDVARMVDEVATAWGRIDILVNSCSYIRSPRRCPSRSLSL